MIIAFIACAESQKQQQQQITDWQIVDCDIVNNIRSLIESSPQYKIENRDNNNKMRTNNTRFCSTSIYSSTSRHGAHAVFVFIAQTDYDYVQFTLVFFHSTTCYCVNRSIIITFSQFNVPMVSVSFLSLSLFFSFNRKNSNQMQFVHFFSNICFHCNACLHFAFWEWKKSVVFSLLSFTFCQFFFVLFSFDEPSE